MYPRSNLLKFAGLLHPLKTPNQTVPSNSSEIKIGDYREGLIIGIKGKKFIDVGIKELINYTGKQNIGKKRYYSKFLTEILSWILRVAQVFLLEKLRKNFLMQR